MQIIDITTFFTNDADIDYINMQACPKDWCNNIVVIGNFDGLHKGHQALIEYAKNIAKNSQQKILMLSFTPHPKAFFSADDEYKYITDAILKHNLAKYYGVHCVITQKFDQDFANLTPKEFIQNILIAQCKAQHIIVGEDFRFGTKRQGGIIELQQEPNLTIHPISLQQLGDNIYSSSRIKQYISQGNLQGAHDMLRHRFLLQGVIQQEKQLGRTLGFATANISMQNIIRPLYGVYAVQAYVKGKKYQAIANIGCRPTIDDTLIDKCEVHIFNFDAMVYGEVLIVEFHEFIREEKKFSGLDSLKKQIKEDCEQVKKYFYLNK